jgi:hypothetical protein
MRDSNDISEVLGSSISLSVGSDGYFGGAWGVESNNSVTQKLS